MHEKLKLDDIHDPALINFHVGADGDHVLLEVKAHGGAHFGIRFWGDDVVGLKGLIEKLLAEHPEVLTWGASGPAN